MTTKSSYNFHRIFSVYSWVGYGFWVRYKDDEDVAFALDVEKMEKEGGWMDEWIRRDECWEFREGRKSRMKNSIFYLSYNKVWCGFDIITTNHRHIWWKSYFFLLPPNRLPSHFSFTIIYLRWFHLHRALIVWDYEVIFGREMIENLIHQFFPLSFFL